MNEIMQNFQFIRPLFLMAALPVFIVYLLKLKFGQKQNLWQQLLPQHLYQRMVISKGLQKASRYIHYALFAWLISVVAIAGPTWEKLPQAVYQTQAGKVILMDMSMSMRATDLAPDRLTRARFKANDLINQVNEGETGLIAYSGDAFVISPLTDDANTLISLIPSLKPEIMPTQGSSALRGLELSAELLSNAGYQSGQIYWLTDGILYEEVGDIRRFIQNSKFDVSALLIGTENGAPIQLENGKLLKDNSGSIVVPSINSRYLNQAMSGTGGTYSIFASDNSDIAAIKRKVEFEQQQQAQEVENTTGDVYKDMGPYLLLLVLPFAAYAFRRGLMMVCIVSVVGIASIPTKPAFAATQVSNPSDSDTAASTSTNSQDLGSGFAFKNWFKNADQQGKEAFDQENYDKAQSLFESQSWRAASAYKSGDYQKALDLYSGLSGTENTYNKANALAKLGKLQEALDDYNAVLDAEPGHENAQRNKAIVEELLKQQQEQQEQQDQQDQENGQDSEQNQDSDQNSSQNSEQNSEQGDSSEQDGDQSEQDQQDAGEQGENQQNDDSQSKEESNENSDAENSESDKKQDENLQQQAQQQNEREQNDAAGEQQQNQSSPQQGPQEVPQDQQQEAISADQFDMSNMTPEEKEEMQRMQMIMNKVPDDPAYLLQRKMMLEAYKRERQPVPTQENW